MSQIKREKGVTTIQAGNMSVETDKINRHRYNELRKKRPITLKDIFLAIRRNCETAKVKRAAKKAN